MAKNKLNKKSVYSGECFMLTTKHAKSIAIGPPFWDRLNASVIEYVVDTDTLGTFSGEVARSGNALECARRKCEWALKKLDNKVEFALASEGSFGPHPGIPWLACDQEILYFIDRRHDFHLHLSHLSKKTNYRMETIDSIEALYQFADSVQFPSHALILRPNNRETHSPIFKGINSTTALKEAFTECQRYAIEGNVWIETDMRAQFNPSRMAVIKELSEKLADRLDTHCLKCNSPGWGIIRSETGLNCRDCGGKTSLTKHEIYGCAKCSYEEIHTPSHGLKLAEPGNCPYCNP